MVKMMIQRRGEEAWRGKIKKSIDLLEVEVKLLMVLSRSKTLIWKSQKNRVGNKEGQVPGKDPVPLDPGHHLPILQSEEIGDRPNEGCEASLLWDPKLGNFDSWGPRRLTRKILGQGPETNGAPIRGASNRKRGIRGGQRRYMKTGHKKG